MIESSSDTNLRDLLAQAVKREEEIYSQVCEVVSIDQENRTITASPIDGSADILEVRIQGGEAGNPFVCFPVEGSAVIITFLSLSTAFVSMCSEVEKIEIRGVDFGGLVKAPELVDQLAIMSSRIDTIYDAINNATPIAQDGGVGLQNTMKATLSSQTQNEDFSNIENENVKHG